MTLTGDTGDRRPAVGPREIAGVALTLGAVAVLTFARFAAHGGLYYDDWADAAGRFYTPGGPTLGHVLSYFHDILGYRPILVVYTPLKYVVFGTHSGWLIAWSAALGVATSATLYALLRTLRIAWPHALTIATLTFVYPWSDSLRLWESASSVPLSIAMALGGVLAATRAVAGGPRRLHVLSAALFVASLLTYELTLPLIAAAGAVYVAAAGWQRARVRWGFDIGLAGVGALWVRTHTARAVSGPGAAWTHARQIAREGSMIAARTLDPSGTHAHSAFVFILAGVAVVAALALELRGRSEGRPWLMMIAAGLAVATLGWLAVVPADPYYTPSVFGIANRVNAIAGIGLVLAAYGLLGLIAWLVGVAVAPARRAAPALTVVLGLALGGGYVHVVERHIDIWQTAARSQHTVIQSLNAAYPRLPEGATVFTTGFPGWETFGVPIFAEPWDLNGRVKFLYDDATVSGYPIVGERRLECRAGGVAVGGGGGPSEPAPYGTAYLLNVETGTTATPRDRADCERGVASFPAGALTRRSGY